MFGRFTARKQKSSTWLVLLRLATFFTSVRVVSVRASGMRSLKPIQMCYTAIAQIENAGGDVDFHPGQLGYSPSLPGPRAG